MVVLLFHYRPKVDVYCTTSAEFITRYPSVAAYAFPNEKRQPVQCPIDELAIAQLRVRLPQRSSHSTVKGKVISVGGGRPFCDSSMSASISRMGSQYFGGTGSQLAICGPQGGVPIDCYGLPGLRVFPQNVRLDPPAALADSCSQDSQSQMSSYGFHGAAVAAAPPAVAPSTAAAAASALVPAALAAPVPDALAAPVLAGPATTTKDAAKDCEAPSAGDEVDQMASEFAAALGKPTPGPLQKPPQRATALKKRPAAAGPAAKKPAAKAPKVEPKPAAKASDVLKYPGVPTKACEAKSFRDYKIYTSMGKMAWRVLKLGERVDFSFSFSGVKEDPKKAWARLRQHVLDGV